MAGVTGLHCLSDPWPPRDPCRHYAFLVCCIPSPVIGTLPSFLASILTLVFDIASTSLLPHIVSRKQLVEGNSKLVLSDSVVSIAGPGVAGNLIDMLTAPLAMLVDAVSFLGSALCLSVIHPHEDTAARA